MFLTFLIITLWIVANKVNTSLNGDHPYACAAVYSIIVSLATFIHGSSLTFVLLLVVALFLLNSLYFKISGQINGVVNYCLFLIPGFFICLPMPYIAIDHTVHYVYWKNIQKESRSCVVSVVNELNNSSRSDLENELKDLESSFSGDQKIDHKYVQRVAKTYMISDFLSPGQNPDDFNIKYFKNVGLGPGCHFDFLVLQYQRMRGLTELQKSNVCQGWESLDKEFTFWKIPEGTEDLRY